MGGGAHRQLEARAVGECGGIASGANQDPLVRRRPAAGTHRAGGIDRDHLVADEAVAQRADQRADRGAGPDHAAVLVDHRHASAERIAVLAGPLCARPAHIAAFAGRRCVAPRRQQREPLGQLGGVDAAGADARVLQQRQAAVDGRPERDGAVG
jgi:hypothetical protein